MNSIQSLSVKIKTLNHKDYGAYQLLIGKYNFTDFTLFIEQIPKDPYAPAHTGFYRLILPLSYTGIFIEKNWSIIEKTALCDYFNRKFFQVSKVKSSTRRGTGNSGIITINEPGQTVLKRSSIILHERDIEVRFFIGLPADGREINSELASVMLNLELPDIVECVFSRNKLKKEIIEFHIRTVVESNFLRSQLRSQNLIAFIANDSLLPRKDGSSDEPLDKKQVCPFLSPESLEISLNLPDGSLIKGMAIKTGITLITGGGYHGKSTLLKAIEQGIYDHIPGDGREKVVTNKSAVKVRAYSGRYVENVNISTFIKNLPRQKDTNSFSTANASGSTSQAATIMEAIEAGAEALLMDEDTCAGNFMFRDLKMQKLIDKNDEPITSYIDRAEELFSKSGISTILVAGSMGNYLNISDSIIQMRGFIALDVTEKAKLICKRFDQKRMKEDQSYPIDSGKRKIILHSINPDNVYNKRSVYAKEIHRIHFGIVELDLTDLEQLTELSQTKAIMDSILYLKDNSDEDSGLIETINKLFIALKESGFDILSDKKSGFYSEFRPYELAAAINRLRGLKMEQI